MVEGGDPEEACVAPTVSLQTPRPLQQLQVPLISRETCSCLYNINAVPEEPHTIQQDMLCAGYVKGGKDACQVRGDRHTLGSGGLSEAGLDDCWPEACPDTALSSLG